LAALATIVIAVPSIASAQDKPMMKEGMHEGMHHRMHPLKGINMHHRHHHMRRMMKKEGM
jgi:hypothetical protein